MRIVKAEGPTSSPLLAIVGEAPGQHEEATGRPFVGPSGHLLTSMLSAAGIARNECYITNLSKERPPHNNFTLRYYEDGNPKFPTRELLQLHEALYQELLQIQPKVVVTMGAEAFKALTPYTSLKAYRGTLIEHRQLRIIPTYHPAYILRGMYHERPIVEADLRKARRQATNPSVPSTNFLVAPSFSEVIGLLQQRPKRISLDLETVRNHTRLIGIGWSARDAISIPLITGQSSSWSQEDEAHIIHELQQLLLSEETEKVLQNMSYDLTILAREFGLEVKNVVLDTMLAHHLLYPELPKGLDFLSSIYTDHPMYWGGSLGPLYNCYDCAVTYEVSTILERELEERGMLEFYRNIPHRLAMHLIYVQSRGIAIDLKERKELQQTTEQELAELLERIQSAAGFDLNPSSPKQVAELLYEKWKLPPQYHPKTRRITVDDDSLKVLAKRQTLYDRVLRDLILYRQKKVLLSTFINMELHNGRAYTSYNVAGTVTGRLSSSATIDGYGGNLQNIPRKTFRRIFVPDPEHVLIKADLSQAEYRVLIWKARITRIIEKWMEDPKFNIHMWNAANNIYHVPMEGVTPEMYSNAKNGTYGANYGIGPQKVSRMYEIDYKEAKFIIEQYHKAMPEVREVYQKELRDEVNRTREIVNPFGRKRLFFGRLDDELYRAVYSHYCQSTVGDLINSALSTLVEEGVDVLLQVHDELVVQCKASELDRTAHLVRKAMEQPIKFPGIDVPLIIPCELKVGPNWHDTVLYNPKQ